MSLFWIVPFSLQAVAAGVDELWFHRRRGLPLWERISHPIDTLSILTCASISLFWEPTLDRLKIFLFMAVFSCLLTTKDEWMHAKRCDPAESWLHALLFLLHPIVLAEIALLWFLTAPSLPASSLTSWSDSGFPDIDQARNLILAYSALTTLFLAHQILFWSRRHDLVQSPASPLRR